MYKKYYMPNKFNWFHLSICFHGLSFFVIIYLQKKLNLFKKLLSKTQRKLPKRSKGEIVKFL